MDYNFFESVKEKRKQTNLLKIIVYVAVIAILGILIIGAGLNMLELRRLENEVRGLEEQELANQAQLLELTELEAQIAELRPQSVYIYETELLREELRVFSTQVMHDLQISTPPQLYLEELRFSDNTFTMQGIMPEIEILTRFLYNLRNLDLFEQPFSPQILQEDYGYSFILEVQIRNIQPDEQEEGDVEQNDIEDGTIDE